MRNINQTSLDLSIFLNAKNPILCYNIKTEKTRRRALPLKSSVKLPIGIEDFQEIRTEGFYYVDKTRMISELLNNWGKVNLFTRPGRFGKSLNMNMLKYFFSCGCDAALFDGLAISAEKELCEKYTKHRLDLQFIL